MKYFVQLKDDVVFAYHQSSTEVDIPGDNIIEVAQEGFNYLGKKYVNGDFVDAPLIKYAIVDEDNDNTVISIEKTIFASDVKGPIITDQNVKVLWKWNGSDFVSPSAVLALPTITVGGNQVTTSELAPARTDEQFEEERVAAEAHQALLAASAAQLAELEATQTQITEE
jgi:hypothetical protein